MNIAILGVRGTKMTDSERVRATEKIIEISKRYDDCKFDLSNGNSVLIILFEELINGDE